MKSNYSRSVFMIVMLLVIFVLSSIATVSVYADDTTPPPIETPVVVTPPVGESTPADPAPMEETVAELLTQVPEGTEVVVVNDEGDVLPLATEEAAQVITNGDPMWCPVGVTPGAASCTGMFNDFNGAGGLLPAINNKNVAGIIWVQNTYASTEGGVAINLSPGTVGTTANFALSINGGWTGAGTAISGTSTFTVPLLITGWMGAITLNNIVFDGVSITNAANDNSALNVVTSGNILLNNVTVEGSTNPNAVHVMNGASLDNTGGAGNVTINKSSFNNNEGQGLQVNSKGTITLANVLANGNNAGGAYLNNTFAASAKAVTITTGTNEFSNNTGLGSGDGLHIESKGGVYLKDITANGNGGEGVQVLNHLAASAQLVKLTGTNVFQGNGAYGFAVYSRGAISISNMTANNSTGWGAELDNTFATTPQTIKITGDNEFNFNGSGGLWIKSKGAVTLNNITANGNSGKGAQVINTLAATSQGVTLTGTNIFSDNANMGLLVESLGVISVSNLVNNSNGDWGVKLDNHTAVTPQTIKITGNNEFKFNGSGLWMLSRGSVTMNNINASNNGIYGALLWVGYGFPGGVTMTGIKIFNDNGGNGLELHTEAAIILNNITANGNGDYGAYLKNTGAYTPSAVIITGTNTFDNNSTGGLRVESIGAVTLNNVTASNNNGDGAWIGNNCVDVLAACTGSFLGVPQNVTLTAASTFNGNYGTGLIVNTFGTITIANLTANENGAGAGSGNGAELNNNGGTLPKAVTLTGINKFNNNDGGGLYINSKGAITLSSVTASNNVTGYGALIDNDEAALPKAVTLTGYGVFNDNEDGGLYIYTKGAITLNNVTANENHNLANNAGGHGVRLDNLASTSASPQNITIHGTNTFNGNFGAGLWVYTYGAILTNNLTANENGGQGVMLDSKDENNPVIKPVTLNGINTFNGNQNDNSNSEQNPDFTILAGLDIVAYGKVTASKLEGSNNLGKGITVRSWGGLATSGINITGWVYTDNNGDWGLHLSSDGHITVANININEGGSTYGVWLEAYKEVDDISGNITVTGTSQIFNTNAIGLRITTEGGSVTLGNLTVSENGSYGVYIDTTGAGNVGPQNVTINGFNTLWDNGSMGLYINTYGTVTISNLDVYSNDSNGVYVNVLAAKNVTITGSNFFESNGANGLYVSTLGAISISNLHSKDNTGNGAYLKNQWGVGSLGGITLTGINSFEKNGASGLIALSNGAISMSNLTADLNNGNGVWLDNESVNGNTAVAVTLTGVNTFTNNTLGSGLVIFAGGQITLSNVTASGNQASGAILDNKTNTSSLLIKPGVKLTGLNIFNLNLATGLDILSYGAVDLVNITADDNIADGIHANTVGTFTMICSSMNENTGSGWDLTAGGLITLKGVFGFGNAPNFTSSNPVTVRACLVPKPVVLLPADDSEKELHGSTRIALVYNPYSRK